MPSYLLDRSASLARAMFAGSGLRLSVFLGVLLLAQQTFATKLDEVDQKDGSPATEESQTLDRVRRHYLLGGKLTAWEGGEEDLLNSVFSEGQVYPAVERILHHGHRADTRPLHRCKRGERGCELSPSCEELGISEILYKPTVNTAGTLVFIYKPQGDPLDVDWKFKSRNILGSWHSSEAQLDRPPEKTMSKETYTKELYIVSNWSVRPPRLRKSLRKGVQVKLTIRNKFQSGPSRCRLSWTLSPRKSSETQLWHARR